VIFVADILASEDLGDPLMWWLGVVGSESVNDSIPLVLAEGVHDCEVGMTLGDGLQRTLYLFPYLS
jgi:hypothetical protein